MTDKITDTCPVCHLPLPESRTEQLAHMEWHHNLRRLLRLLSAP
jgi:hypothetical protein